MAVNPTSLYGVNQVDTNALAPVPSADESDAMYPPAGMNPPEPRPADVKRLEEGEITHPAGGSGIEGEQTVWEARYSMRNFIGRLIVRTLLTLVWAGIGVYTWGMGHSEMVVPTVALGIGLGLLWLTLIYRIVQARQGHYYRLTTRRLFVSTGLLNRRRDQLELLRVEDVYTHQGLFERWLSLGTVVVVSSEESLPTVAMPGVDDPKHVMDLVWHHARAERDQRSVKVQEI
ncbi:MAG: PH domain-containing protein [Isosphaeraceae bacterium]|nr:PH domain-containing protein [Isosphaeraceae bacterium]